MQPPRVIIDTCVLIAALRSKRGAANKLLRLLDTGLFTVVVSVPLVLEYEATAKRLVPELHSDAEIEKFINTLCDVSEHQEIHYLWRPVLADAQDEMVLEVAVAGSCDYIVTFNSRDFATIQNFGVKVVTPETLLKLIGVIHEHD